MNTMYSSVLVTDLCLSTATQFSCGASAELPGLQQNLLSALNDIKHGDLRTQGCSSPETCPRCGVLS